MLFEIKNGSDLLGDYPSLLCRKDRWKKQLSFSLSSSIRTHTPTHKQITTKDNEFLPFFSSFLALVRDKPTILLQHVIQESNTILMIL
jgi:hypothetical protein